MNPSTVADFDISVPLNHLEARAEKAAGALVEIGCGEDQPVALIMRNDLAQLEIMRAAAQAGTVLVALNWHGAADEAQAICEDSGAHNWRAPRGG